jgi:hypothetical protein
VTDDARTWARRAQGPARELAANETDAAGARSRGVGSVRLDVGGELSDRAFEGAPLDYLGEIAQANDYVWLAGVD